MSRRKPVSVISVDDNPMMAEAVPQILETSEEFQHLGHFLSGAGVLDAVIARAPELVLMDVDIPGTDTRALVKQLTNARPETRVVMLSAHLIKEDILGCIQAGALGYVHKDRSQSEIIDTLRRVANGEFVLCDEAARAAGLL